jgi:MFS superfamily sulfate permease-like transporter
MSRSFDSPRVEAASATPTTPVLEKPQNGLAGLKYWRYDLRSGFMVALISLPFSMGIAITSGAPAVCGITSAIIAGFLLPFLGGSYVTISGPAAGLAPVLFAGIMPLGRGDLQAGYPRLLAAICVAGVVQFILSKCKARGDDSRLNILGLERLRPTSADKTCLRLAHHEYLAPAPSAV